MLPPTWQTLCGFLLAALGAAIGWGFGLFFVAQVTHAIVRVVY